MELLAHLGAGLVFGAGLGQNIPFQIFFIYCYLINADLRPLFNDL